MSVDLSTVTFAEFVQIWCLQENFGTLPQIHREFCDWAEQTIPSKHRLALAFRESAKSTIFSLYACWRLMKDPNYTCMIMSAGKELAARNSRLIRRTIEHHPLTKHLVPDKDNWQSNRFTVLRPSRGLHPSVTITSVGSKMTGFHGDEILVDDIEIAENCKTPEAREELRTVFYELNNMSSRLFFWGTPHDTETIYDWLEYEKGYDTRKWPVFMEDGVTPRWPAQRGTEWIAAKKDTLPTGVFNSQYLLIPDRAYDTRFKWDSIKWFPDVLQRATYEELVGGNGFYIGDYDIKDVRAFWDPALGVAKRDHSVLAIAAKSYDNRIFITDLITLPPVDLENDGMAPQFMEIIDAMKRNLCNKVYVEDNFIKTLPVELRAFAARHRARIQVKETTRTSLQKKKEFISYAIEPLLNVGKFHVHSKIQENKFFRDEFLSFPNGRHDDHLDAIAGAIKELLPSRIDTSREGWLVDDPVRPAIEVMKINDYRPLSNAA